MFSKLQMWILAGCLVITTIGFGWFAFRTNGPLRQALASEPSNSSSPAPPEEQQSTIPHGSLKPYPVQHSPSVITNGNEADEKVIDADMKKLGNSFKTGDWAIAIDLMYTPMLDSLGGRKKAMETVEALKVQMKEQNLALTWNLKKPFTYVRGKSHKYAIIPDEARGGAGGVVVKQAGYELGIKTGSQWQYVGADQLTPEL